MSISKRMQALNLIPLKSKYELHDALQQIKILSNAKFNETIDVAVHLGIDVRKSDQMVRGSSVLPHGLGKEIQVVVFAEGELVREATEAGALRVGMEDLAKAFEAEEITCNVVIATPSAMKMVGRLGKILGPKGLMPNPKLGTVTNDVGKAVKRAKQGQVFYRAEKAGIIHSPIGKADFTVDMLAENLKVILSDLKSLQPATSKGKYIKKVSLSSTMGPSMNLDLLSLSI